jgi:ATP-dependent RNA helicase DeaD
MEPTLFSELTLSPEVQQALQEMGFDNATPVQLQAIPMILEGSDVLGQAATGTGKTGAFGIPAVELVNAALNVTQCLILCPTRELAVQVCEEIKKIARFKQGLVVAPIYGGESIEKQLRQLERGVHIVVGTPGRVIDHIERGSLELDKVELVILDEADEMLNMGFRDDIEHVLNRITQPHQTLLFSATMSKDIMNIAKRFQFEPKILKTTKHELTAPNIKQLYYVVKPRGKADAMAKLVEFHQLERCIVFCNTKRMVDELAETLTLKGIPAEGLHGDMQQNKRTTVMNRFRIGKVKMLIATDVAARGIDVQEIDAVFNYDIPVDDEFYVHRIGRTGRNGRFGTSFTLVNDREVGKLRGIMKFTNSIIEEDFLPTFKQIQERRMALFLAKITESAPKTEINNYAEPMQLLMDAGLSPEQIIATLMQEILGEPKVEVEEPKYSQYGERAERRDRPERTDRFERGGSSDRYPRSDRNSSSRDSRDSRGERAPFGRPERGPRLDRFDGPRPERTEFREPREPRAPRAPREVDANMTRLWVSIGRIDRVRPGDLVGAIAGEANLPGNSIGAIDIFEKFSFVDVPSGSAQEVIKAMDNNMIRRKRVNVSLANQAAPVE